MSDNKTTPSVTAPAAPAPLTPANTGKGTITSAAIPQPGSVPQRVSQSPELDDNIIAKPLVTPDFINVKPKNPQHIFYWGNRVAGGGMRLEELMAKGFVPAKPEDVQDMRGCLNKEGKVCYGDLILMKHDRATYLGALKHNHDKANNRVSRQATADRGTKLVREELSNAGASSSVQSKISTFVPTQAETEALTGK